MAVKWFQEWFGAVVLRRRTEEPQIQSDRSIDYSIPTTDISITHNFPSPPLSCILFDDADTEGEADTDQEIVPDIVSHLICTGPSIKHKHIFETLSSCAFLTHLIIIKSNIDALPGSTIASLLNLQVIDVSDNMLTELPETISRLKQLQKLFIMYNRLVHLPIGLLELPVLEQVAVDGNYMLSWPPLRIALLGVAEIKSYMHEALSRQNIREDLLKNSKPYGSSLFGAASNSRHVPSLQQLASSIIVDRKIDFQGQLDVPPLMKRRLTAADDLSKFHITISRCSMCLMYFSSKVAYQAHICKFNQN